MKQLELTRVHVKEAWPNEDEICRLQGSFLHDLDELKQHYDRAVEQEVSKRMAAEERVCDREEGGGREGRSGPTFLMRSIVSIFGQATTRASSYPGTVERVCAGSLPVAICGPLKHRFFENPIMLYIKIPVHPSMHIP